MRVFFVSHEEMKDTKYTKKNALAFAKALLNAIIYLNL